MLSRCEDFCCAIFNDKEKLHKWTSVQIKQVVFGLVGLQSDKYALYSSFFAVRNTIQNVIFPLNRFRVRVMDVQRIAQNVFIIMVTYTRAPILRVFFFVSFILLSLCIRFQRQRFFLYLSSTLLNFFIIPQIFALISIM